MKWKILLFTILIAIIIAFVGCKTNVDETYTVWTDFSSYTDFKTTLSDGYYIRLEFTNDQWNQFSSSLTSEGRHYWTKDQIKDWLIGRGFGNSESTQEVAWLTTIDHGFIATRTGNTVYYLLK